MTAMIMAANLMLLGHGLVSNGKANAVIAIPMRSTETQFEAAMELQEYIEKTTSVNMKISFVAPTDGVYFLQDGHFIEVAQGAGQDALSGVYDLLEIWGARWFMPGEIGEEYPIISELNFPAKLEHKVGDFVGRWVMADKWGRRNRAGGLYVPGGQTWSYLVSPEEYFASHPEYFSLINGERIPATPHSGQLCTSNPAVAKIMADKVIAFYDTNPLEMDAVFPLSPADNGDFCQCEKCKALDKTSGEYADRIVEFLNRIAAMVSKKHPTRKLTFLAYSCYTRPPELHRLHPMLIPQIARIGRFTQYANGVAGAGDNSRELRRVFKKWCELSTTVATYEYYGHYSWFAFLPMLHSLRYDIPFYKMVGVDVVCNEVHPHWATQGLNLWVASRLLWDSNQDGESWLEIDQLLVEYCEGMYHKAAPAMNLFFRSLESWRGDLPDDLSPALMPNLFTDRRLMVLNRLLTRAFSLAKGDEKATKRLELIKVGLQFTEHETHAMQAISAGKHKKAVKELNKCREIVHESVAVGAFHADLVMAVLDRTIKRLENP